jgi:hypothetical protein
LGLKPYYKRPTGSGQPASVALTGCLGVPAALTGGTGSDTLKRKFGTRVLDWR